MKTLVCWDAEKANKLAAKLMEQGKVVIMNRMMSGGIFAYRVKFNQ